MEVYPAIKGKIGSWHYYMVRMSMQEIANNVKFASEADGDPTELSDAIQRVLNQPRVRNEISNYLLNHEDRFFSSIVVAALQGDPQWHPVRMEGEKFEIFKSEKKLSEAFGVLTFNGEQTYYALDGQHRLAAIRAIIADQAKEPIPNKFLENFRNEEVSVLIVMPQGLEAESDFKLRYRRLFGHLNRYAKPMSHFDSIVMDEDDALAIVTRRLVSNHPFFKSSGGEFESSRVKMKPGKNVTPSSTHFTSLEMLYETNIALLSSAERQNRGWFEDGRKFRDFCKFRPSEETIDLLEEELFACWDLIVEALPVLDSPPELMRVHNPTANGQGESNALFLPIVQELVAKIARGLIDEKISRRRKPKSGAIAALGSEVLKPLGRLEWNAQEVPWRHVLLVRKVDDLSKWVVAGADRKTRMEILECVLRWQLGLDPLTPEEVSDRGGLADRWKVMATLDAKPKVGPMWERIADGALL